MSVNSTNKLKITLKYHLNKIILLLFGYFILFGNQAQSISGYILNEENDPIPFVNIYIKELKTGTATDAKGRYFMNIETGDYEMIISSIGYKTKTIKIIIGDKAVTKNIWLATNSTEIDQIVIKAKKKDPAFEIIQKVIEKRKSYLSQAKSYRSEVYVKAVEELDIKEKKKPEKNESFNITIEAVPQQSFEPTNKKNKNPLSNTNMVELQLRLNYQYPDKYKEERLGYKAYGDKTGLYIPKISEADFNFYNNLVDLKEIVEVPIISPISRTAILSYKYKLDKTEIENGMMVYKIKVIPRKTGNSTCHGYLFINDSLWNINRLDLSFSKGGLKFYDDFNIRQSYKKVNGEIWIPYRQEFFYKTKLGKSKIFEGSTILQFLDFQNNYSFDDKFFDNEIIVTKKLAYNRDSSYWNSTRPEPLTIKQQKVVAYRDSIDLVLNSAEYLDSIDAKYNKVTLGEVLIAGVDFRNRKKQNQYYFPSLLSLVNFEVIGGFRLGPYANYYKKWENGKALSTYGYLSVGLRNQDVIGNLNTWYRYNPHKLADITIKTGRLFQSINSFDAYLNQLRASNYILNDEFSISHRSELFNGFYLKIKANYNNRQSVANYDSKSLLNSIVDETDPLSFQDYQALVTEVKFDFTPAQKYMTEPNEKIILGSKYPTFSFTYRKGWQDILNSDINFDYVDFEVKQNLVLGVIGNSNYSLKTGKFTNTKDLRFVDLKRFRQSDPFLYSDPLNSFQLLDTSLVARDLFFEAHHIHHFNGALINNIPLIKKLRLRVVAGAGALWVKEDNYRHAEIFAGFERVFKIGKRRRLRLGFYGVAAESNRTKPKTDFKISFDIIDVWKKNWSY